MVHKLRDQFAPVVEHGVTRTLLGLLLLLICILVSRKQGESLLVLLSASLVAWAISVVLTDKYRHKYPQRYYPYLVASHTRANVLMGLLLSLGWLVDYDSVSSSTVLTGFICFLVADLLISLPRKRVAPQSIAQMTRSFLPADQEGREDAPATPLRDISKQEIIEKLRIQNAPHVAFLETALPDSKGSSRASTLDEETQLKGIPHDLDILVCDFRLNDVRRINRFLLECTERIALGGYLVALYEPLEAVAERYQRRPRILFYLHFLFHRIFPKIPSLNRLYFTLTRGKNRTLSQAEVWGRLTFCGFSVEREKIQQKQALFLARRVQKPVENRTPSYYPIVPLLKVGLNGSFIYTRKVRTMYPFSEFLQKKIFEDHGLTDQGKFKNDFRLTEYGPSLRKYWLDEVPQLFDWLRGEIKLVGVRATSPQYLSLYPMEFLELYLQVKSGLIPPIFDENTTGFDDIVRVEQTYLERYWQGAAMTDIKYFFQTFTDIFFRGIRSN